MLALDWGQNMSFGIFMGKAAFDALDAKDQAVIRAVGSDYVDHLARTMTEEFDNDKADLEKGIGGKKVAIRALPADQRATVQAAGRKHIDAWAAEASGAGVDGPGLLAAYRQSIAKYAAEMKAKGYPWRR